MSFVLKHRLTSEIFAFPMLNNYQIPYYGVKSWTSIDEAETELASFLSNQNIQAIDDWSLHEVEDNELKLFNVKLKNDPERKLYLDDQGKPVSKRIT
ncbi:hypothetical protein E0485_12395 [Paenibacillus albiflavus]|uniref:Uncharacterized protein n=1 Tax=Paenibacillus albiflavus TaxID=2545760 RepID=A0A4R4EDW7_9BACL|nr:hypothetical protein [Paenibacillus albiflavus]TCZ77250.1 hypothetical protein E0485_12395 [Paenibacillus albiflavus]